MKEILLDLAWDLGWWTGIRLREPEWRSALYPSGATCVAGSILKRHLRHTPRKVRAEVGQQIRAGLKAALRKEATR